MCVETQLDGAGSPSDHHHAVPAGAGQEHGQGPSLMHQTILHKVSSAPQPCVDPGPRIVILSRFFFGNILFILCHIPVHIHYIFTQVNSAMIFQIVIHNVSPTFYKHND